MDSIILVLLVVAIVLQLVLLFKKPNISGDLDRAEERLRQTVDGVGQRTDENFRKVELQLAAQQKEWLERQTEQQEKLYTTLDNNNSRTNRVLSETVEKLQESNEKKLDQMRETVDEKLNTTLTERLDSSFKTVSEQLKNVYTSLGEMQKLSGDVSDLQRVLTNVKARGTWAEVQLGNLLEQTLTEEQFGRNVSIRNNRERVEFAIKIPSQKKDGEYIWLPIDSKFPQEDYLRIVDASDACDKDALEDALKSLEKFIKAQAKTIQDLYIDVPNTTDFAIMFLPTEGLYAEVLRRPGLVEELQNKFRVMVCGPTTLTAFLNTLRMGFRTIALDKQASEVWKVLGAVKEQYGTFGNLLEKAHKKVEEAGSVLDDAQKRATIIQKKLRGVEQLPDPSDAERLLGIGEVGAELPDEE